MISQPFKIASNISIPGSVLNKLTVSGNVSSTRVVYASGGNSDLWNSTYATVSSLSANTILVGGNSKGADITIGTNDNYALNLETAGTTKVTVTSAGFVGIGNTTPSTILDINDGTAAQKDVTLTLRNGNFGWWKMTSSNTNTAGFLRFASNNSGQTPLTLDAATGNVGITNNNPTARLDIADTTSAGSGGLAGSVFNLTQTWNTSGAPTAIKLNVTNTASNAASKLIDLQVGGVSLLNQTVPGLLRVGGVGFSNAYGIVTEGGISVGSGASFIAGSQLNVYNGGLNVCSLNTSGLQTTSTGAVTWGSGTSISTPDLYLVRDGAGILAQRNGTNAQESRIYGTYTSTTNYERLALKYNGSVYQIGTEKGSVGGVAKPLQFYTDSIVQMVIPTTGLITVRDETGTQQQLINNYTYLNNSFSDGGPTAAQWLLDASTNNILHNYANRLTVTNTGTTAASGVFTQLIEWPLSELTNVNGMVYADGFVILRFYSGGNAQSVRCRVWNNVASAWSSYSAAVDITKLTSFGLWRASVGGNYMTKLEVETTSPPGNAVNLQAVEYYPTRNNGGICYPHYFAAQGAGKLLFGGGKSTHAAIVGSGNILKIRNGNDSADGSITAAAGTFSTTLSVAGISTFSTIRATSIDLIRSDGNLMPGALATSNVGGDFVTIGNSGNSNGTLIYGNGTNGVGINVGSTVGLIKPTVLGQSNGTTNTTNLAIYNTQGGQTQVGLKFGNMSTSANSNIAINFGDYTDAAYSQIRGVYNGAVQTGQIAFLTANGGALAESLRITNTGNVGIGTITPNEKLTVAGVISSSNVVYALGGNSNLWNSAYATVNSISANGATTYTTVNANSASWSSVYSTVCATSANYILDGGNTKGANIFIGTNDNYNLNLETAGTTKMTVTSSGNVGVGTTSPTNLLHIYSEATSGAAQLLVQNDTNTTVPIMQFLRRRASGAAVINQDSLGRISALAAKSSSVNLQAGYIDFQAFGTPSGFNNVLPSKINFATFIDDTYATYANSIINGAFVAGGTTGQFIFNKNDNIGGDYVPDTGISRLSAGKIGIGNATAGTSAGTLIAGNIGIGTTSPAEKLDVVGNVKVSGHFSAVTKSFLIDHPTKVDKKLQYGVVESNQHSVLVRGKTAKNIIELPEEWSGLVHEDSITVHLTPVGTYQKLFVILQDNEKVVVGGVNGLYNYTIYGERKDVDRLQTEI